MAILVSDLSTSGLGICFTKGISTQLLRGAFPSYGRHTRPAGLELMPKYCTVATVAWMASCLSMYPRGLGRIVLDH